jgi:hypothetical protein
MYEQDDEGHWMVFGRIVPTLAAEEWALILGDAIHNARSALDLLVTQLLALNGRQPNQRNGFRSTTRDRAARGRRSGLRTTSKAFARLTPLASGNYSPSGIRLRASHGCSRRWPNSTTSTSTAYFIPYSRTRTVKD